VKIPVNRRSKRDVESRRNSSWFLFKLKLLIFAFLVAVVALVVGNMIIMSLDTMLLALLFMAAARFIARPYAGNVRRAFHKLARQRAVAIGLIGLLALALNVLMGVLVHLPVPATRDEFSYLLAADTFAQGRLTNPTHPMWEHFDTGHVIHQPTYQSKYPPGQGLVLAAGQTMLGHPIAGVWVSVGVACAAVCWMLQGWMTPRWALLGGLLTVMNIGIFEQWGQSYWGGAVAMTGGALLFGALPRVIRRQRPRDALVLAAGVAILANTRPYEGLLAMLPAVVMLSVWFMGKDKASAALFLRKVVLPILLVLLPTALSMCYYNLRVTGDPLRMPYQVWLENRGLQISGVVFSALHDLPPARHFDPRSSVDIDAFESLRREAEKQEAVRHPIVKLVRNYMFYIGVALAIPFVMLPFILRDPWIRFAVVTCVIVLAGVLLNAAGGFPHYIAMLTGLIMAIVMEGMRYLQICRWHRKSFGKVIVGVLPVLSCALMVSFLATTWIHRPVKAHNAWSLKRAEIEDRLSHDSERHLVIVRYAPEHVWYREWVNNRAEIDRAQVVWAKELDNEANRRLVDYFEGRRVWLLEADSEKRVLAPYAGEAS